MRSLEPLVQSVKDLIKVGPRFFYSGIRARMSRAEFVRVQLPGGLQICVRPRDSDFDTVRQVFRDKEYEFPAGVRDKVSTEYRATLERGSRPLIIDAGANIGAASLWFRQQFPDAEIVMIEPDSSSSGLARRNLLGIRDITLYEAAIGGGAGYVSATTSALSWATQTTRSGEGIPVVTLNELTARTASGAIFIAKIDIEGFEADLFSANVEWLDHVFAIFIEPHDWMIPGGRTSANFQREFGLRNFDIFICGENILYIKSDDEA